MEGGGGRNKADCCRREGRREGEGEGANVLSALRQTFSLPGLFLVASHLAYITKGSSREGKHGRFFPCFLVKVMDGWMPL